MSDTSAGFVYILSLLSIALFTTVHGFAVGVPPDGLQQRLPVTFLAASDDDTVEQRQESVQAFLDYHVGTWRGTARSFAVTNDKAAGVVRRKAIGPYTTTVAWVETSSSPSSASSPILQEQWSLEQEDGENKQDHRLLHKREMDVLDCNMDIDSVDASYSLDQHDFDEDDRLPVEWTGLHASAGDTGFMVEKCITASNNQRIRCWIMYGGEEKALQRVVICDEERVQQPEQGGNLHDAAASTTNPYDPSTLTARDMFEIESDIDRLVDKVAGIPANKAQSPPTSPSVADRLQAAMKDDGDSLQPNPMTLLELTKPGEVWLGDAVVRDHGQIPMSPVGFDTKKRERRSEPAVFGSWILGVQKVAWRWSWPSYGPTLVSTVDAGNNLGAAGVVVQPSPRSGELIVDESLSRRTKVDDRIICIDWEGGYVGFWLGGWVGVQIPRHMNFDHTGRIRPFYTELSVVQKGRGDPGEIVCSKLSRIYNYKGQFKQGLSAFYSLQQQGDAQIVEASNENP